MLGNGVLPINLGSNTELAIGDAGEVNHTVLTGFGPAPLPVRGAT